MWSYLFKTKTCVHDKAHVKTNTYCERCVNALKERKSKLGTDDVPVELRALMLTILENLHTPSESECWSIKATLPEKINGYRLKNLIYSLYKGDIGNNVIKNTCNNIKCVNPYHLKSRFEPDQITQRVRVGFSRRYVNLTDLTDDQWLRY